jgi:hypothetical protein
MIAIILKNGQVFLPFRNPFGAFGNLRDRPHTVNSLRSAAVSLYRQKQQQHLPERMNTENHSCLKQAVFTEEPE